MIFFWLASLSSLFLFLAAQFLFIVPTDSYSLIMALFIVLMVPFLIPLVATIRDDSELPRPFFTRAGIIGTGISVLLVLVGIFGFHWSSSFLLFFLVLFLWGYFGLESRIWFLGALGGLVYTILALVFSMDALAEMLSAGVYLMLVLGVGSELISPLFVAIHRDSPKLLQISPEFWEHYRRDFSSLSLLVALLSAALLFILTLGRGHWWNFESQIFVFLSFGVSIFFTLFLILRDRAYTLRSFFTNTYDVPIVYWKKLSPKKRRIILIGGTILLATISIYPSIALLWSVSIALVVFFLVSGVLFGSIQYFFHEKK